MAEDKDAVCSGEWALGKEWPETERKLELVKLVLTYVEQNQINDESLVASSIRVEGYTQEEVYHAIRLLDEEKLLLVYASEVDRLSHLPTHRMSEVKVIRLTWDGHEFLDSAKSPQVWEEAKQAVSRTGGSVSLRMFLWTMEEVAKRLLNAALQYVGVPG